jgi:hypothetical protein
MKILRKKRPQMVAGDWDNAPVHTAVKVTDWLAARDVKLIEHPPYSPDLALADYFLFPRVKRELAGLTLTQETFKKEWEGVRISRRRTSLRCSGDGFSTMRSVLRSAADTLRKAKNINCPNYYCFLIIGVFRIVSILTPYFLLEYVVELEQKTAHISKHGNMMKIPQAEHVDTLIFSRIITEIKH